MTIIRNRNRPILVDREILEDPDLSFAAIGLCTCLEKMYTDNNRKPIDKEDLAKERSVPLEEINSLLKEIFKVGYYEEE